MHPSLVLSVSCLLFGLLVSMVSSQTPTVKDCPKDCACFFVTAPDVDPSSVWVNCENMKFAPNALTSFPTNTSLPNKTYALDLTFNAIQKLNRTDNFPFLRILRISANSIQAIDEHAFEGFPSLESLTLSYNNISTIPLQALKPLTHLKVLDLSNNHIDFIPKQAFDNENLEELILSHNPLKVIFDEWFENLSSLKKLHLDETKLFSIGPDDFMKLKQLEYLDLSGNLFSSVPNEGLRLLSNLKTLKLNNNNLKVLDRDSFAHMSSLVNLEVCQNDHLTQIHSRAFSDLVNLENLTIAENHDLTFIDPAAFRGMYSIGGHFPTIKLSNSSSGFKLRHLSLRRNSLSILPAYALPYTKLQYLDLTQNPWNCDCTFLWVREIHGVVGDPRCASPDEYRGIEIHNLPPKVCHESEHSSLHTAHEKTPELKVVKSMILLMAATLLFVLGVAIAMVMKRNPNRKERGSIYYVKAETNPGVDVPVGSLI